VSDLPDLVGAVRQRWRLGHHVDGLTPAQPVDHAWQPVDGELQRRLAQPGQAPDQVPTDPQRGDRGHDHRDQPDQAGPDDVGEHDVGGRLAALDQPVSAGELEALQITGHPVEGAPPGGGVDRWRGAGPAVGDHPVLQRGERGERGGGGERLVIHPVTLVQVGQSLGEQEPLRSDQLDRLTEVGRRERAGRDRPADHGVLLAQQLPRPAQVQQRPGLPVKVLIGHSHQRREHAERGVEDLVVAAQRGGPVEGSVVDVGAQRRQRVQVEQQFVEPAGGLVGGGAARGRAGGAGAERADRGVRLGPLGQQRPRVPAAPVATKAKLSLRSACSSTTTAWAGRPMLSTLFWASSRLIPGPIVTAVASAHMAISVMRGTSSTATIFARIDQVRVAGARLRLRITPRPGEYVHGGRRASRRTSGV
jgi:hypothetical protein